MISTFGSKPEFLDALASRLEDGVVPSALRSCLVAGIATADETLRAEPDDDLALNLKVGGWVIRDDDLPLFQALNATGAAVALTLTTGGMAWPAVAAAVSSLADLCWRAWRKGVRLSSTQVAVYGQLQARGPMKADALVRALDQTRDEPIPLDVVEATLTSLRELETHDGRLLALAARDDHAVWKALRI